MVFYVVSKKYTPLRPIVGAGFEFNLDGSRGTAIPGPSGIFLRVKYDPATISKIVNYVVAHGPGSKGHQVGLPDTQIWSSSPQGTTSSHFSRAIGPFPSSLPHSSST